MSAQARAPATLFPGKIPGTHEHKTVGFRYIPDDSGEQFEPGAVQPVANLLHRLRYTGSLLTVSIASEL